MIPDLKGPKNFDLRRYAIGKLAQDINSAFCDHFNSDRVFYFLESCKARRALQDGREVCACGTHRLVWHGDGLVGFINGAINLSLKQQNAPVLFVTPLDSKNKINAVRYELALLRDKVNDAYEMARQYSKHEGSAYKYKVYCRLYDAYQRLETKEKEIENKLNSLEYWIGDVSSDGQMICCDPMWGYLWNELRR